MKKFPHSVIPAEWQPAPNKQFAKDATKNTVMFWVTRKKKPLPLRLALKKVIRHTLVRDVRTITSTLMWTRSVIPAARRLAPNKQSAQDVTKNTATFWDTIIKTTYAHVAEPNVQAKVLNIR